MTSTWLSYVLLALGASQNFSVEYGEGRFVVVQTLRLLTVVYAMISVAAAGLVELSTAYREVRVHDNLMTGG